MKTFNVLFCIVFFAACSRPAQTPIVFSLQTDVVSKTLQLNADSTFSYKTKHIQGVPFNEEGTYTVTDSSVILNYTNPSYSYNCWEVPIINDTFLFVPYKEIMYLVRANQPSEEQRAIFIKNLTQSINDHTFNLFEEDMYLPHTEGNLELIYTKK